MSGWRVVHFLSVSTMLGHPVLSGDDDRPRSSNQPIINLVADHKDLREVEVGEA
jgi:hypothetical protein